MVVGALVEGAWRKRRRYDPRPAGSMMTKDPGDNGRHKTALGLVSTMYSVLRTL